MSGRRVAFGVLAGCAVLAFSVNVRAAERPPTHGMALDSVAMLVAADLLSGVELPEGRPIVIAIPVPGDTLGLLTQRLVERLRGRGAVVRLSSHAGNGAPFPNGAPGTEPQGSAAGGSIGTGAGTIAPDGAVPATGIGIDSVGIAPAPPPARDPVRGPGPVQLQLQVDGSGVSYVRRLGKFPFGTKGYERLSAMRAAATLLDPATGDVFWTRSASRSLTDIVPKGAVAYAASGSGRLNPAVPRGGTRWLEPLIVVGVVAGLVVLFYSNRN